MTTWKLTLLATVVGTAVGVLAWMFDLTRWIWPDHPELAGFVLTIISTIVVRLAWPTDSRATT